MRRGKERRKGERPVGEEGACYLYPLWLFALFFFGTIVFSSNPFLSRTQEARAPKLPSLFQQTRMLTAQRTPLAPSASSAATGGSPNGVRKLDTSKQQGLKAVKPTTPGMRESSGIEEQRREDWRGRGEEESVRLSERGRKKKNEIEARDS